VQYKDVGSIYGEDPCRGIMILPSSHSPALRADHAMGAARWEPRRGGIPMRRSANLRRVSTKTWENQNRNTG